jgi:hypothetical protein
MSTETQVSGDQTVDLDRIVRELDVPWGEFPEEALRAAQRHSRSITPKLVEVLRVVTQRAAAGEMPAGCAYFFAFFLLGEFRAKEALPAIVDIMSLPEDVTYELFGDTRSEVLPRVLAILDADERVTIDRLIGDRSIDEYTRWAAVSSYSYLATSGKLTRNEAIASLVRHFREALANRDEALLTPLVCELDAFRASEAIDLIRDAYRLGLIDESMIDLAMIERDFARDDPQASRLGSALHDTPIVDAVEELRDWVRVNDRNESPNEFSPTWREESLGDDWEADEVPVDETPTGTFRRSTPKVGRNDPCPCGSGRKFKKCCAARTSPDNQ